jgi:TolB-like protein/class 3 adenylate cyclase
LSEERVERRLAAILAADVVGYSRLIGEDEAGTLARLRGHRRDLIDPKVAEHRGRVVKSTGDGILVEFPSVVEAVACAVAVQHGMAERNVESPEHQRIIFRVGINLGDVIVEDGDIHGDGVNVAARLEGIAEPGGICVSAVVREQVEGRFDCAFDDLGEQALKNIARSVRVYRVRLATAETAPTASSVKRTPTLALPDKPSIAVLPFQNMSGDPEQEYFVDGMVEEIITALSRIRWLFVIARNSSFIYKGQAVDLKRVGRELGVRYVLEGSVRKAGDRVRITAQLIDAETGTHLWADRFNGSLEDVFELQDQIATSVAGVIEPALQAAENARSARRPTKDLTAYDLYLRAYAIGVSAAARIPEALRLVEQAIERDPEYGPALAYAAICHFLRVFNNQSQDLGADRRMAVELARRALQAAGDDLGTIVNSAAVLGFFGEDIGAMIALVDRALARHPSSARGWYISGVLRRWAGYSDLAIEHFQAALRLSPVARIGWTTNGIGAALFCGRRFEEAVPMLLLAIQEDPTLPEQYRTIAACYAHMGRLDDAQEILTRLRAVTSVVIPDVSYLRNPEHRALFLSGLRLAMGETA